jgi:hypothetical protein
MFSQGAQDALLYTKQHKTTQNNTKQHGIYQLIARVVSIVIG